MKQILLIAITFILWFITAMILELDYRTNNNHFLSSLSPIQWFVIIFIIWGIVSVFNLYLLLNNKDLMSMNLRSLNIFFNIEELIICITPISNLFIMIYLVYKRLNKLINNTENQFQQELEEELKKNTIQDK